MSKISIIIPVYNLEKYLSRCLDSVVAQTYKDFEVIAIDDGSTDKSSQILDDYAKKDKRITPFHIANAGVSNARNFGLDKSGGEYIYFLDGDDWIEPNTLQLLMDNIGDFDMVQTAYDRVCSDGNIINEDFTDKTLNGYECILGSYFLGEIKESSCNKLYKKGTIGNLRFDIDLKVAEDSVFVHSFMKKAQGIKLMTNITYHYNIHNESCMNSKLEDYHFFTMELRDRYLSECEGNEELYKKWVSFEVHLCFYLIKLILLNGDKKYQHKIEEYRKRTVTKKRYILFSNYYNFRFKIGVLILWLCPKLFYKIYGK